MSDQQLMNALYVISPYRVSGQWVFDDSSKNLEKEPLVCGADTLCSKLYGEYGDFNAVFSDSVLPAWDFHLKKNVEKDCMSGTWYKLATDLISDDNDDEGYEGLDVWLCPALFRYYSKAPDALFIKGDKRV